jgi:hypothetical protein
MDPCAFADELARTDPTSWAHDLYKETAMMIGDIWGSRLNLCPLVEKIVYMGTFAQRFFGFEEFKTLVHLTIIERSMFRDFHRKIQIIPSTASHGALLGAARIFHRLASTA